MGASPSGAEGAGWKKSVSDRCALSGGLRGGPGCGWTSQARRMRAYRQASHSTSLSAGPHERGRHRTTRWSKRRCRRGMPRTQGAGRAVWRHAHVAPMRVRARRGLTRRHAHRPTPPHIRVPTHAHTHGWSGAGPLPAGGGLLTRPPRPRPPGAARDHLSRRKLSTMWASERSHTCIHAVAALLTAKPAAARDPRQASARRGSALAHTPCALHSTARPPRAVSSHARRGRDSNSRVAEAGERGGIMERIGGKSHIKT